MMTQKSSFTQLWLSVFVLFLVAPASAFEALPSRAPAPKDNPTTPAKVELGRKLFFDPRLSKAGSISCNSCHNVMAGGDDMRPNSIGHEFKKGGRSAPTVWNAAFLSSQFWDGRAATLEDQAKGPITNPIEMGMPNHDLAVDRIAAIPGYQAEFKVAFKGEAKITIDLIAKAIAAYERTLITPNSAYDKYVKGQKSALSAQQKRGFELVQTVGCTGCHLAPHFSSPAFQKFPVIPGSEYESKYRLTEDGGRFEVTKNPADKGMWRVPTWRNVALTAPYFHNGSVKTLPEAVKIMAKTQLARDLSEDQVNDIVSFLDSLTGPFPTQTMPRLHQLNGRSSIEE